MFTNKVVCNINTMGTKGKDLSSVKETNILKLNNEGKSGSVIGKVLGINRFTVCKCFKSY